MRNFVKQREQGERFATWAVRADEADLTMSLREERRTMTETELQQLAERGAAELEGASADDLLRWTDEHFGGRIRGGVEHAGRGAGRDGRQGAARRRRAVPGHRLPLRRDHRHPRRRRGRLRRQRRERHARRTASPSRTQLFGKDLFAREPSECCRMRKVEPLGKALHGYSAWVTGIRRVEAPTRANAPLISFDKAFGLVKINPLAAWTDEDMQDYIDANDILVNPLVFEGYPSIGCAPCTAKPVEGADPRSGRWQGLAKTECGLHAS